MIKIVITGGVNSGKTMAQALVCEALRKAGYSVTPTEIGSDGKREDDGPILESKLAQWLSESKRTRLRPRKVSVICINP